MINHCSYTHNLSSCEIVVTYYELCDQLRDDLIAQVVEYHRGHGFASRSGLIFFQNFTNA